MRGFRLDFSTDPVYYIFKPNGISHYYQLDQSISALRVVGW